MTDRVKRMKDSLRVNKYPLCIELFRLANESLDETGGEPTLLRRAKLHAHILDNITIFIEPEDLLCGSGASKPFGLEMQYEYGVWTPDEVESLKSEIYTIEPEDEAELYRLNEHFAGNCLNANLVGEMSKCLGLDDRMWPFMQSGVILPPWKDRQGGSGGGFAMSGYGLGPGFFLVCIDYERILREGAQSVIDEAKQCLKDLRYTSGDAIKKRHYWEAVIIVFEAWIRFVHRYADLCGALAAEEKDEKRAGELREMARICRKVPQYPAESFREALQSFWFSFLMALPSPTTSAGRFDQYMYPYYKRDVDSGAITDAEVLELLEIMRCKVMKINRVSGKANRAKNAGMAKWYNWTIGGVKEDGSDATNELSYLLLESAKETLLPHFTITLRVHENTPPELMKKALEVVRTGIGMPAFVGDKGDRQQRRHRRSPDPPAGPGHPRRRRGRAVHRRPEHPRHPGGAHVPAGASRHRVHDLRGRAPQRRGGAAVRDRGHEDLPGPAENPLPLPVFRGDPAGLPGRLYVHRQLLRPHRGHLLLHPGGAVRRVRGAQPALPDGLHPVAHAGAQHPPRLQLLPRGAGHLLQAAPVLRLHRPGPPGAALGLPGPRDQEGGEEARGRGEGRINPLRHPQTFV